MNIRVYYADTDAAGVVYHAQYLAYLERGRSEYFRERGLSVAGMAAEGMIFPVVRMEVDFKHPAVLDDLLTVLTAPLRLGGSSFTLRQQVLRQADGKLLVEALVSLACVNKSLRPIRIPSQVGSLLELELQSGTADLAANG